MTVFEYEQAKRESEQREMGYHYAFLQRLHVSRGTSSDTISSKSGSDSQVKPTINGGYSKKRKQPADHVSKYYKDRNEALLKAYQTEITI